ncbi:MAG: FAD-binding oxidoreductase [Pseudomonadota bacterium]
MLDANAREHTTSYYAASQRDKAPFATLEQDIEAEVCVVGGGFSGVATTLELAERGIDVVLLEANRIGWGASGRNGGQVIGGYGSKLTNTPSATDKQLGKGASDKILAMGTECVDIIRERVDKYSIECDLEWGFLNVALKAREMNEFEEWKDELEEQGYPHECKLLDRQELKDYLGTDRYLGGLTDMGWGHCQVLDLIKGEARAAEKLGAKIFEQSLVTDITGGAEVVVKTASGRVKAKTLVLCGNAYLAQMAPRVAPKLSKYVLPATSYIIATEPLSDNLAKDVMPHNYAVCDQRTALDYFRLSADNRMLFGGVSNYSATAPLSISRTLRSKMLKVFPQLEEAKIDFAWGGRMGIGLNRIPQLGQLERNIYYAQAYGGHGVAPTHMSGRLLAEAITGERSRFDIMAGVNHMPFPGFGIARQAMFAAGMSFYKLKDMVA